MKPKQILCFSLSLLVFGVAFLSCDSEDNSPVISEWKFEKCKADVEVTDPTLKDSIVKFIESISLSDVGSYTFKENGTYSSFLTPFCGTGLEYPKDYIRNGKYKFKGDSIVLDDYNPASLYFEDGTLCRIGSNSRDLVSEYLKIDGTKIIKARSIIIYHRVK